MNKFNRFEDIDHRPLRTYNRAVMFFNLATDQGLSVAGEYLNTFSKEEKLEIAQITAMVKELGTKRVIELVTKGLIFTDEPYKEELDEAI